MKSVALAALAAGWVSALVLGIRGLETFSNSPGLAAIDSGASWPDPSASSHSYDRPTLVMFIHPKCPCSRSSIGELTRFLTRYNRQVEAHVFFLLPVDQDETWAHSDLYASAAAIPGVHLHLDIAGRDAKLFGARTSGQTMLFDREGALIFEGGITGSRGHHGDNAGRALLERQLVSPSGGVERFSVFGCTLFSNGDSMGGESRND